ncbi:MAG: YeeE/YedE family protein [Sphingomonas sp.]|uniref:DUF6691 family protein n=1 Tax=Sphingomonas sp. TaxID=28214 RepID=UPI00260F4B60|nr:DUF6691 family protein [Sphingomonas sp.]MDK2767983.1 YeeE/YedE family protein [Sphingomonas sp.]
MKKLLVALASGLIFGLGLIVSAMVSPGKVLAFLDVTAPSWDPSLAVVLVSAVVVSAIGFEVGRRRKAPLFASAFNGPSNRALDGKLLVGAALFGIGWGLVGYCPGPALVALGLGAPPALVFIIAMLVGMGSFALLQRYQAAGAGS